MKSKFFFFIIIAIFIIFNSCTSFEKFDYSKPEIEKTNAYVIDTFKNDESMEDYVKLHNNSSESNINFNVYMHHPELQKWIIYGTGFLKDAGDTDTIDTDMGDIDEYRYFAIESLSDIEFNYFFFKKNNDLHINILDK